MSVDLIALWDERDRARDAWYAFVDEAIADAGKATPLNIARDLLYDERTEEEQRMVDDDWTRRNTLLAALYDVEHRIRVATGHEKLEK